MSPQTRASESCNYTLSRVDAHTAFPQHSEGKMRELDRAESYHPLVVAEQLLHCSGLTLSHYTRPLHFHPHEKNQALFQQLPTVRIPCGSISQ